MEQLQKVVYDLVEDLDSWSQKKLSKADQYISQERDAIELAQTHFSQLQERWEIYGKIDLETFKNWAKQKYALEYQAQAFSERARMLKGQGVLQKELVPKPKPPLVVSQPDLPGGSPGGSVEDALSRFYITPEHIRKHIRDYGGDIDRLASMDMQYHLSVFDPDRVHAVRTIILGRMEDIESGPDLQIVQDGVVATIAPEKALHHLKTLRDTLTNRLIKGLEVALPLGWYEELTDSFKNKPIYGSFIGEDKKATIYFAMKHFESLEEQHLRELSGVIDQRLASIEDTDASPSFDSPLYVERLSLYMLQDMVAEKHALLLGQDPPTKSPLSLPRFYITAEDIYKVHGWHRWHGWKESIALDLQGL